MLMEEVSSFPELYLVELNDEMEVKPTNSEAPFDGFVAHAPEVPAHYGAKGGAQRASNAPCWFSLLDVAQGFKAVGALGEVPRGSVPLAGADVQRINALNVEVAKGPVRSLSDLAAAIKFDKRWTRTKDRGHKAVCCNDVPT